MSFILPEGVRFMTDIVIIGGWRAGKNAQYLEKYGSSRRYLAPPRDNALTVEQLSKLHGTLAQTEIQQLDYRAVEARVLAQYRTTTPRNTTKALNKRKHAFYQARKRAQDANINKYDRRYPHGCY